MLIQVTFYFSSAVYLYRWIKSRWWCWLVMTVCLLRCVVCKASEANLSQFEYIKSGTGQIKVNGRNVEDYFKKASERMLIEQPLRTVKAHKNFDMFINVSGGGTTGQAGAVVLGSARALCLVNDEFEKTLRANNFLTRDSRMRERKKYGQKGARARFQFSKR